MKLKDIHTNLSEEINLQKFYIKKEISVDSFYLKKNIIFDLSKKLKNTINLKISKKIKINSFKNGKKLDVLKSRTSNNNLLIVDKKIEQGKIVDQIKEKKLTSINIKNNNIFRSNNFLKESISVKKLLTFINYKIGKIKINKKRYFRFFFIIFFIVLILFLNKIIIEHFTNSGYQKLLEIKNNKKIENREEFLKGLNRDFVIANVLFKVFYIIPGEKVNNAKNIILGGLKISKLLINLNVFGTGVENIVESKGYKEIMFSQLLYNNKDFLIYLEKEILDVQNIYDKIKFKKNSDLDKKMLNLKSKINEIYFYINTINNNFETFLDLLGHNERKKYLIVFQNNDEIRPGGGFMGSMGIVELFRGKIKKFEKKDVYDYEFKIRKEKFKRETAPEGLIKLTSKLGLRDSNYYINDKESSEKIRFFIEKAGYDIDGIIYVNQNSLFKILDITGEFNSDVLKTKITSKNFSLIMSSLVESKKSKYGTLGTPKQVLFDFIKEFEQILKENNITKLNILESILTDIKNREIVFYSFDEEERKLLKNLNLYNPIEYNESLDFSYPVYTSISGNKSDRFMHISYKKNIKKGLDCSYETSLEINLEHKFDLKEEKKVEEIFNKFGIVNEYDELLNIQGKGENRQYIRVVLPKDSIIKNDNVGITDYNNKGKVVDFYIYTKAGKKSSFKIDYILPNKECILYNYKIYKQPGIRKYDLQINKFGKIDIFNNISKDFYIN